MTNKKRKPTDVGREVIEIEAEAVARLVDRIDRDFERAVELIAQCSGRVVVTGMGKSGLISQKIASTLASTGTPANFLHPAEALHGDLGMVTGDDLVLVVSRSGETGEIVQLMYAFFHLGTKVVALVGRKESTLASMADVALDASVDREACSLDLAPTASTTAALAMGDALAIALMERKGFERDDYALLHPSGALGKRLHLRVRQIMHARDQLPVVKVDSDVKSTLLEISQKRLGVAIVMADNGELAGIITDGDLRRAFEQDGHIMDRTAESLMTKDPKWVSEDTPAIQALEIMEEFSITSLFVYKDDRFSGIPAGIVHIHDILKSGLT
ncbi:MAG: KpsF/GutQ family sugar-phosphate isomerase [Candidatus Neomarinimicrobiota bacterium]